MKIVKVLLRNFRRLENVEIKFETKETVFVGPNNSGKTSATAAFRLFIVKPDFKIHDFSVSRIAEFDAFGFADDVDETTVPWIGMDLWFSVDPNVEFGRVFSLLPNVSSNFEEVGIRLKYCVEDAGILKSKYQSAFTPPLEGDEQKSLSHYLSLSGNLRNHFGLKFFAIENTAKGLVEIPIEPDEGRRVLQALVRVDFVDAQRNMDDQETGRSNRLSAAFAAFYRKNLEKPEKNGNRPGNPPYLTMSISAIVQA